MTATREFWIEATDPLIAIIQQTSLYAKPELRALIMLAERNEFTNQDQGYRVFTTFMKITRDYEFVYGRATFFFEYLPGVVSYTVELIEMLESPIISSNRGLIPEKFWEESEEDPSTIDEDQNFDENLEDPKLVECMVGPLSCLGKHFVSLDYPEILDLETGLCTPEEIGPDEMELDVTFLDPQKNEIYEHATATMIIKADTEGGRVDVLDFVKFKEPKKNFYCPGH